MQRASTGSDNDMLIAQRIMSKRTAGVLPRALQRMPRQVPLLLENRDLARVY
jgi:hypothetical protein